MDSFKTKVHLKRVQKLHIGTDIITRHSVIASMAKTIAKNLQSNTAITATYMMHTEIDNIQKSII